MGWRIAILWLGACGTVGCSYATGTIDYSEHLS